MRTLVTGGAGYVGSVSVERLVAAGHDVIVLDSLVTGHRAAVTDGARLVHGTLRDRDALAAAPARGADRHRAALRGAITGGAVGGRSRPCTTARTWSAGSACSTPCSRRESSGWSSRPPPRSTARPSRCRSRRTRRSSRSTRTARRSAPSRARCAGTARRTGCAASRCATSTWPARRRGTASSTIPRRTWSRTCWRRRSVAASSRCSARTTRRPMAPASATTSTSRTWPTRTWPRWS